jgi:predicted nucleic acid-binding protein
VVTRAFVDTSAFLTLLDRADPRHQRAAGAFTELVAASELVTHGYVVAESMAVTRRHFGVDGVVALLDDLLPVVTILPVDLAAHTAAQAQYRASLPSGISFVDHVSFVLIERERIPVALALDGDFARTGVAIIPS